MNAVERFRRKVRLVQKRMHATNDTKANGSKRNIGYSSSRLPIECQPIRFEALCDTLVLALLTAVERICDYSYQIVRTMPLVVTGFVRWKDDRKVDPITRRK